MGAGGPLSAPSRWLSLVLTRARASPRGMHPCSYRVGHQLLVHTVACAVSTATVGIGGVLTFGVMKLCNRLRVTEEDELTGLDFKCVSRLCASARGCSPNAWPRTV